MKSKSTLYQICIIVIIFFLSIISKSLKAQTCPLIINTVTTESKCKSTGSINATVTNGLGQYNYTVTSATYSTTTSSNIIDGLQAGTYSLKVKDLTTGCITQKDNIIVAGNYEDPRFQLSVTDIGCINGSNGSIKVIGLQYGKAPFTFSIVAPSVYGIGKTSNTGVFNNLIAGNYSIQLKDSCGGLQTRVITISDYNWSITDIGANKIGCDSLGVLVSASDNRGNTNAFGNAFAGFLYGVSTTPGDTVWYTKNSFSLYKGTLKKVSIVVKDPCGNIKTMIWNDVTKPTVNDIVAVTNKICKTFNAAITGQINLVSPQYCLYNSANVLVSCNATGQFNTLAYGSYCINIKDKCYDTIISRCFTVTQPQPIVGDVVTDNHFCTTFTATLTGGQSLGRQYCIVDSNNVTIACNSTGVFNNLPYGSYCINVTDGCSSMVTKKCFTQRRPIPAIAAPVAITNNDCTSFTANLSGQVNIVNGQYCIYNVNGTLIACNSTGIFTGLIYGTYCIRMVNSTACYDTTIVRCFTANRPIPSIAEDVTIKNKFCAGFSAAITEIRNANNPQYCLYQKNKLIKCNTTGQFDSLSYGAYCIRMKNDNTCYDTTIERCFSATAPLPSVNNTVDISNKACATFSAIITGKVNLTNPQYCLYSKTNKLISCNTTGVFDGLAYDAYCIKIVNTCYDTTITRCFTENPSPLSININSTASCSLGTSSMLVTINNGVAPYTIKVYNPGGILVSTVTTNSSPATISGLPGLPNGSKYKIVVTGNCNAKDSTSVFPVVFSLSRNVNANSKCPGGVWQNGSGDLRVYAQFNGGRVIPSIISKNGASVNIPYTTQNGSNFTFANMEPAIYIIQYKVQGCANFIYDTTVLKPYKYPSLNQSAVYQCNNNNFSVNAAASSGVTPYIYEIIGSSPNFPSINSAPQNNAVFAIQNGAVYSVVRLRATDACGNAAINDASIMPLANTIVTASSNCFYNNILLSVDTIPNATYTWYKKTSATDSILLSTNQNYTIPYLLPSDTGVYISVVSVNSGCLSKIANFSVNGSCGGIVLATNGLSFEGKLEKENVQLKWTTVKDFKAEKFIVERSTDGKNFTGIATVAISESNSNTLSQYLFADVNAVTGKSFYRIKVIKANNKIAYSDIITITKHGKITISAMPNPVTDVVYIKFDEVKAGNYNVSLVSTSGSVIVNNNYTIRTGDVKALQRTSTMATGLYYLTIRNTTNNEKEIIKLIFK